MEFRVIQNYPISLCFNASIKRSSPAYDKVKMELDIVGTLFLAAACLAVISTPFDASVDLSIFMIKVVNRALTNENIVRYAQSGVTHPCFAPSPELQDIFREPNPAPTP